MILNHIYVHHSFRHSAGTKFREGVKLTRFSLSACNLQRMDLHYAIPNQLYMHIHDEFQYFHTEQQSFALQVRYVFY